MEEEILKIVLSFLKQEQELNHFLIGLIGQAVVLFEQTGYTSEVCFHLIN